MENNMKTITQIIAATIFIGGIFGVAAPTFATEAGEALRSCRAHPKTCTVEGVHEKTGTLILTTGTGVIECPVKGPCIVLIKPNTKSNNDGSSHNNNTAQGNGGGTDGITGGGGLSGGDGTGSPHTGANGGTSGGGVIQ
jgi:hypothetical protein